MPTTSNFTPAGLFALNFSIMNCQLFSWLLPTGAIRPESGSIQAIFTTSPASGFAPPLACAAAEPADTASATPMHAARALLRGAEVGLFMSSPGGQRESSRKLTDVLRGGLQGLPRKHASRT